ncbi:hypothetical protein J2751_000830 [Halorubrum alkaliphilum]|uniref:Uncharacterized protein n=1 Tax=Halorubrum alkaliphilum TaxID=261290 RepID=A0A8T4GCJ9_9EURY|nr:hypothetical protein [Halorubrum alkaliphilum]MBP1921833.1 hypothetical protein [Halorubrum alkaliphilum]
MATSYTSGLTNLSGKQNMLLDTLALAIVPFFGSFIFGVFTFEVNIFGGYDFASPIWTVAGAEISAALLIVLGGVAWILATNAIDGNDYQPEELAIVAIAFLAPLMYVFIPAFETLVNYHDLSRVFFTLLLSVATVWISYTA